MWLCKVPDVTSDSDIQHPSSLWCYGQEGVHPTLAKSGGWSSDDTSGAMVGLRPPEARDLDARGTDRGDRIRPQEMEENGEERSGSVDI